MRTPKIAAAANRVVAVPLLLAGAVAGVSPASPAAATWLRAGQPKLAASCTISGQILGVAATSARNAWAVAATVVFGATVSVRWNGAAWK